MKEMLITIIGAIGSAVAYLFGGWDSAMISLIAFMAIDYVTGIIVAGVFKKSSKTKNGGLESKAGFKGLCRKGAIILFVLVGHLLDVVLGANYIRNAIIIAFMANELISITENAGLMGVPIPSVITKAIEILKDKEKENGSKNV